MQKINAVFPSPPDHARGGVGALRRAIGAMATDGTDARTVPFGIAPLDGALGGGLPCGMLHEVAAAREAEMAAATGFALALAGRLGRRPVLWISEDMALKESGAPYGPGLDDLGLSPERLVTVAAAKSRDVLWAMEEALSCRAVGAVIGEIRGPSVDLTATRRLSLAAGRRDGLALLLRARPAPEASAAATRWVVGAAPSAPDSTFLGPGPPRFAIRLMRNRRGHLGCWVLEWNRVDQCFELASALPEPVAEAALDRPRQAAVA